MGLTEGQYAAKSDAANAVLPAETSCWVCLADENTESRPLLRGGCACRGDAGFAHVSCLADAAAAKAAAKAKAGKDDSKADPWSTCGVCQQDLTGRVNMELALIHYDRYKDKSSLEEHGPFCSFQFRSSLTHLATAYMEANTPAALKKAVRLHRRLLDFDKNIGLSPSNEHGVYLLAQDIARTYANLGGCLVMMKELDEAMEVLREGMKMVEASDEGSDCCLVSGLLTNMAQIHMERREYDKGVALVEQAVDIRDRLCGKESPEYIEVIIALAFANIERGETSKGVKILQQSYPLSKRVLGPNHPETLLQKDVLNRYGGQGAAEANAKKPVVIANACITGVVSRPELNGSNAEVVGYHSDRDRYDVRLADDGKTIALKPTNLMFCNGTKAVLRGLVSASKHNGKHGTILRFECEIGRYAVQLRDEKKRMSVKPENCIACN